MKLLCVLSAICCLLPAIGARVLGLEGTALMLDTFGVRAQWHPAVAFDGENFLVVWEDFRKGDYSNIHCSRVSPTGQMLDPTGIPVCGTAIDQRDPAIAFDGMNYLVCWRANPRLHEHRIHCARVTPERVALDPVPILVAAGQGYRGRAAVAFDGTNFLIAWEDCRSGTSDIYGARVTPDGQVLDSAGFIISAAPGGKYIAAVASSGNECLVAWGDSRSLQRDIYGSRVSPDGTVLDPDGIPISTAPYDQCAAAVAFDGENYLAIWADDRLNRVDIYGARVSPQGMVLDPDGIPVACGSTERFNPALACCGSDYLGVWSSSTPEETDLYGAKVSSDGAVGEEVPVEVAPRTQQHPAVAYGSGEVFVVYNGSTYIYQGKLYANNRIWGKFGPFPGVEEAAGSKPRAATEATIVRGSLVLSRERSADSRQPVVLLDATGRRVMQLQPGANDVRHLSPGVYFVRSPERRESQRVVLVE
ncbi:MAG: T9SS type A sorting domain-containing protein [candidate division WOR-3 bacterium]